MPVAEAGEVDVGAGVDAAVAGSYADCGFVEMKGRAKMLRMLPKGRFEYILCCASFEVRFLQSEYVYMACL